MNTEHSKTTVALHLKRHHPIGYKIIILFSFLLLSGRAIIEFPISISIIMIVFLFSLFVMLYKYHSHEYDRIILNETGIACSYNMPIHLKKLLPCVFLKEKEWSFTWREIDKMELQPIITGSVLPQHIALVLQKKKEIEQIIIPAEWINADSNSMKLPKMVNIFQIRQFKPSELREILFSYPMLAYMKEHAIPLSEDNKLLKGNTLVLMIKYIVVGFILVMGMVWLFLFA